MAAYALTYVLLSPAIGSQAGILATLPVVLAGWLLGLRGGLLVALLAVFLNALLVIGLLDTTLQEWGRMGGLLGSAAMVLIGGITGWLRDLTAMAAREATRRRQAGAGRQRKRCGAFTTS
jgi:hypothetical protein